MQEGWRVLALFAVAVLVGRAAAANAPAPLKPAATFDPTANYEEKHVEGWSVLVNRRLLDKEHRPLCGRAMRQLKDHLYRVTRVVPPAALANLRRVPFWVELNDPKFPCMCYHPSADWLRENGLNPQKAGGVEIANAENFLSWTLPQPWMVLHELAHAYHDQVLGFDNAEVRACYQHAIAAKLYDSVLHYDGRKVRAYAAENEKEYFAESTEAYFGSNDFFPFVRAELKDHDPKMYDLLEKVWGVQKPKK
jgi:hypothetical protein